jgi:hypothetical protein
MNFITDRSKWKKKRNQEDREKNSHFNLEKEKKKQ